MNTEQQQRLASIQAKVSELPNCYSADFHFLLSIVKGQEALERRVAVLHSIGISGIGGSINDFWDRLCGSERRADFCQALHQLCEITGHNNEDRCYLCEAMGARNAEGYYMGERFFDGTKKDYDHRSSNR